MTDIISLTERVLGGEMTIIDYICEVSALDRARTDADTRPDDLFYWEMVRDAHKNGKKLVFISGPVPTEIIYALDFVPLYLDLIPSRLSDNSTLTSKLIYEAETHANPSLCSLNKTNTGILLKGNLGLEPDAYISLPIPCDSARTSCTEMSKFIKAPTLHFDVPLRKDGRSAKYLAMQLERSIEFLESISGKMLDWEQVKYHMELSERSGRLLEKCALLRAAAPCPMSSRMTLWNELMNVLAPTPEMEKLLIKELDICNNRIEAGFSPCPQGEKHRVLLLHNLLWQGIDLTQWLESEYDAVTVMDGLCFKKREFFDKPGDRQDCIRILSERMLSGSKAHAAGVSGEELLESIKHLLQDYKPDVFLFLGSVGCRHAWAATKMVSDVVAEKYGMPMLLLDIDNTNRNYKTEKDIKIAISEYMDTVINKK